MTEADRLLFQKNIAQYVALDPAEFDHFASKMVKKTFEPKAFLLREGEVCRFAAYLISGCVRYFFVLPNGEERTGQFFFENAWLSDYPSFLEKMPCEASIEAIEPTVALFLYRDEMEKMYLELPKMERFGRFMAEQALVGIRKRNQDLLARTPEERYLELFETRPKVIERVPLKLIASFLGVQPESLSRIRKRLFDQRKRA